MNPRLQEAARLDAARDDPGTERERSALPAESLATLLALPGFTFDCLQTEIAKPDRAWLRSVRLDIALHEGELADFADTAALIADVQKG